MKRKHALIKSSNMTESHLTMTIIAHIKVCKHSRIRSSSVAIQIFDNVHVILTKERRLTRLERLCRGHVTARGVRTEIRILDLRSDDTFAICITHQSHRMPFCYSIQSLTSYVWSKLPVTLDKLHAFIESHWLPFRTTVTSISCLRIVRYLRHLCHHVL